MNIFGLGISALGYAVLYWALNVLVQSYKRTGSLNPPPLSVCLGIPGANAANTNPNPPTSGGPSPTVPGTTQAPRPTDPNSINFTPSLSGTPQWQGQ